MLLQRKKKFTYLLDEKPRIHHQQRVEDAEHQERLPADVVQGMGRDLREDEVEEPLGRCADGDAHLADARGEDLGHVDLYITDQDEMSMELEKIYVYVPMAPYPMTCYSMLSITISIDTF